MLIHLMLLVFLAPAQDAGETNETAAQTLAAAQRAAAEHDHRRADALATQAIAQAPTLAEAFYLRGRARFCLGQFSTALADFDQFVKLRPDAESRQWERGIAMYYAGEPARGEKQFALYQTFHDGDVENSVWRFLCMAASQDLAQARTALLPIRGDSRVPMMEVLGLYRGDQSIDDVWRAVESGNPTDDQRAARTFYAHLYLGLYLDATGDADGARRHLAQAAAPELANRRGVNRYMWEVARLHLARAMKR